MKARPTQSRKGVKGGTSSLFVCPLQGQGGTSSLFVCPLWGLGQRPNCFAGDQHLKRTQQRRRQRSVPAPNFARPQTRPQAALPTRVREEPLFRHSPIRFGHKKKSRSFNQLFARCHPDLNWRMKVLQTFALPLGYGTGHKKSGRRDSDSRPPPWQGGALPTELLPHNMCALGRNRTTDTQIFSLLLYRLSYQGER